MQMFERYELPPITWDFPKRRTAAEESVSPIRGTEGP